MSFIRPEVASRLNRWRESLAGGAAAAFGAYLMMVGTDAAVLIGTVLTVGGALLLVAGIQRARFRKGHGGPGVVHLDEGLLTYFGPIEGGSVHVSDLLRVQLDPNEANHAEWVLEHVAGDALRIPVNAEGTDALFDVFAELPGLETRSMLADLQKRPGERILIWQKHTERLH